MWIAEERRRKISFAPQIRSSKASYNERTFERPFSQFCPEAKFRGRLRSIKSCTLVLILLPIFSLLISAKCKCLSIFSWTGENIRSLLACEYVSRSYWTKKMLFRSFQIRFLSCVSIHFEMICLASTSVVVDAKQFWNDWVLMWKICEGFLGPRLECTNFSLSFRIFSAVYHAV